MSNGFDWQTEEEAEKAWAGWDDPPPPSSPINKGPNFQSLRRYWRVIAVVGVLGIAVGLVVWRQVSRRAEATMQAIRADVVSSYNLTHTAAESGDEELFRSLLSGRDSGWTQANLFLFQQKQLFDHPQMGLRAEPASLPFTLQTEPDEQAADQSTVEVELSPDLVQAEVVAVRPFTVLTTGQPTAAEPVLLRQTSLYRRGSQHWLLSPPLNEFWGEWQTIEGERLTVLVPERDLTIGERLAADLDQLLLRACDELADLDCPADWQITLRLEGDPQILREMAEVSVRPSPNSFIELPTPTLVGLPVEDNEAQAEAGYAALLNGYTSQLFRASVADLLGYACCQAVLVYNALVDYQLGELGLQPWPVDAAMYQQVLTERARGQDIERLFRVNEDTSHFYEEDNRPDALYAFLDYLLQTLPDSSPARMIEYLRKGEGFSFWFDRLLADQPDQAEVALLRTDLDRAWWLAAYQAGAETETAELPAQDLYMTCTSLDDPEGEELSSVLRYVAERNVWEEVYEMRGYAWPVFLPGSNQLLLQEFAPVEQQWGLTLLSKGTPRTLAERTPQARLTFGETDPNGRWLVVYFFNDVQQRISAMLYPIDECPDGDCSPVELPGFVRWSPEGTFAIYANTNGDTFPTVISINNRRWSLTNEFAVLAAAPLFLGAGTDPAMDMDQLELVGEGYSPFWVSEHEYGFIRQDPDQMDKQEVVLGEVEAGTQQISTGSQQTILSTADLIQRIPETNQPVDLRLAYVASHPSDSNLLFVAALGRQTPRNQLFIFSLERDGGQPELRLQADMDIYHSLGFSPDGRYLVMTGRDERTNRSSDSTAILLLHHIENNETTPFLTRQPAFLVSTSYNWSADSQWLTFVMTDNMVAAVAPDAHDIRPLVHSHGACTSVTWLNE